MKKTRNDDVEVFIELDERFIMVNDDYMNFKKELEKLISKYAFNRE